ncbi:MAG: L-threonylcarbamoyladenylate synthase, partial [Patescibacteria group bacterium]
MKTVVLKIKSEKPEKKKIEEVIKTMKKGGIIAFPTETVYGLGTSIFNKKGIAKIYQIRKRPAK